MEFENLVQINNKYGLHARASTRVAQLAQQFKSTIWISRDGGGQEVDGKSVLGILTLGAASGSQIRIRVMGDDAEKALDALIQLVHANFHEE